MRPALVSPEAAVPPRPPATAATARRLYTIQVAAYNEPNGAATLAARLRGSGLDAFTEGQGPAGDAPPFRVKVGRYATEAAAAEQLKTLRRSGVSGFVTPLRPAAAAGAR